MESLYDIAFLFVALFALGFTIFIHELGHFLAAEDAVLLSLVSQLVLGLRSLGGQAMVLSIVYQPFPLVDM